MWPQFPITARITSRITFAVIALLGPLTCALALSACGGNGEASDGHGVLLIAIDGLRADHLSSYGYDRTTTPTLDALAAEGVAFTSMMSSAPQVIPAHASLLSGCDPNLARRRVPQWIVADDRQAWRLPPELPRLALELAVDGYRTLALSDAPEVAPMQGFERGFQQFELPFRSVSDARRGVERSGDRCAQWVRGLGPNQRWFCYLHVGDLLRAFDAPEPRYSTLFEERPELDWFPPVGTTDPCLFAVPSTRASVGLVSMAEYEARYDGCLRRIDEALARLLDRLDQDGRLENTTVCVVGTFGMQFGEAGLLLDHGRLSVADLRVPWILRPASRFNFEGARRVDSLASLLDVAPTLLDLVAIGPPARMQGVSQLGVARAETGTARSFAFASCAIQGGYAAFSNSLAYEALIAGDAESELVRAWYGDTGSHLGEAVVRMYPWRTQPFPPLVGKVLDLDSSALPLEQAAREWIERVERERLAVQQPLWRSNVTEANQLERSTSSTATEEEL